MNTKRKFGKTGMQILSFNMAVLSFSQVAWPRLNIQAKEVKNTSWSSAYTWNNKPSSESTVIDHKTITSSELYKYVGWDITSLVKAHYDAGNKTDEPDTVSLEQTVRLIRQMISLIHICSTVRVRPLMQEANWNHQKPCWVQVLLPTQKTAARAVRTTA